jgi:heat shock protein HslJ
MKSKINIITTILFCVFVASCNSPQKITKNNIPTGDNSMTAVDWTGTYQGILPYADCEGIKNQLVLNEDLTYHLKISYLGKEENIYESNGNFTWDKSGSNITLDNSEKQVYQVGENKLFRLDKSGNRIIGDLANYYILNKEDLEITGTYWKLIQLNGKIVEADKEAFIKLLSEDNHLTGNSSCNVINGIFELSDNNGIKFSRIAMTRMACIDNNVEQEFMQVLDQITNYLVTNNELLLKNGEGIVLAKFQSDIFQTN